MAYSTLERPKLHNVKSLKFYPEQHDHHVSFRHKNLPSNFELTVEEHENSRRGYSTRAQSSGFRRCPIYVHDFDTIHPSEGDFVLKAGKHRIGKNTHRLPIEKLEEKYWANWKPDKNGLVLPKPPEIPVAKTDKRVENVKVIKSAPDRRRKTNKIPSNRSHDSQTSYRLQKNTSKSQEIQTDDIVEVKEEAIESEEKCDKETVAEVEKTPDAEAKQEVNSGEVLHDTKFLKHTDSLILAYRKQKEDKEERFDQPKCIRLYKKPGKITSKNYVKGGSYPLKPCLKKENNPKKTNKLPRPGSPIIVSSNYSNRNTKSHHRR